MKNNFYCEAICDLCWASNDRYTIEVQYIDFLNDRYENENQNKKDLCEDCFKKIFNKN